VELLTRGVKHSKANHEDIRSFYGIVNDPTLEITPEDAVKKVQLLDIKLKHANSTIHSISTINKELQVDKDKAVKEKEITQKKLSVYQSALEDIRAKYNIPKNEITELLSMSMGVKNEHVV
jgi:CRISPR/Cas system endoribonuclease Cas6 (RAMP superfamily)